MNIKHVIAALLVAASVQTAMAQNNEIIDTVALAYKLSLEETEIDSLKKVLKTRDLRGEQYNKLKHFYAHKLRKYRTDLRDYNNIVYSSPINKAGKHLKRSANFQIASLFVGIAGGTATALCATQIEAGRYEGISTEGKTALVCSVGITTGCTALGLYIASIVNKRKAGVLMSRMNLNGNTVSYRF